VFGQISNSAAELLLISDVKQPQNLTWFLWN